MDGSGTALDYTHQSAPDEHGQQAGYIARRAWGCHSDVVACDMVKMISTLPQLRLSHRAVCRQNIELTSGTKRQSACDSTWSLGKTCPQACAARHSAEKCARNGRNQAQAKNTAALIGPLPPSAAQNLKYRKISSKWVRCGGGIDVNFTTTTDKQAVHQTGR